VTAAAPRGWLLDTNVVSELRKAKRCHPGVRAWAEAVQPAACFLSRITVAEVRFGIMLAADPGFRADLEAWLRDGVRAWFGERILDVDEDVLLTWRRLTWGAQKASYTYAQPDALIAATALVHELGVVTRNTEDFRRAGVALLNPWKEPDGV
jgi:predicted nucleic acid-binding protein